MGRLDSFFFFLLLPWQSNFKLHSSSSSRMCDHNGMLCLLASNSQSTTHCVTLTSSRTIWLLQGVRVAPGHISVTDVVAMLMPWVRPTGAKWNLGTRGTQSDCNLNRCVCGSLVASDISAMAVRLNLFYNKLFLAGLKIHGQIIFFS